MKLATKTLLGSLMLAGSVNAFASDVSARIVGGDNADRELPWSAAIYEDGVFICGGALVSSKWVVTAAHCIYDENGDSHEYKIVIGDSTRFPNTNSASMWANNLHNVSKAVIHEAYDDETKNNDIALLQLNIPHYAPSLAIADSNRFDQVIKGDELSVIGFGYTSNQKDTAPKLQEAKLPFIPTEECIWRNSNAYSDDNMFCAGYKAGDLQIDSCQGDSGSPLFTKIDGELTLVGLVSWGYQTCGQMEAVYTKISNLKDWVLSNIADTKQGYQIVEEGTANYDRDTGKFTDGLLTVTNFSDEAITIDNLIFRNSQATVASVITMGANTCSGNNIEAGDSCAINFALAITPPNDEYFKVFTAILPVTSASDTEAKEYGVRLTVGDTPNKDTSTSNGSPYDNINGDNQGSSGGNTSNTSTANTSSKSSGGGGSFGIISLLLLVPAFLLRRGSKQKQ